MADIEHIKLLCRGVDAWNKARVETPFAPDLSHVEIRDAVLSNANFDGAEFDGARLFNVDAKGLRCRQARLNGVRATLTDFSGSDMHGAEFKGADFTRVGCRDVDLSKVETFQFWVRHCDLSGADLTGARLGGTHFYNSNLQGAVFGDAEMQAAAFKRVRTEPETVQELGAKGAVLALMNEPREDEWIDFTQFDVDDHSEDFGRILYRNRICWISAGRWDFFISHASVDKDAVARPLAEALRRLDQKVWYDELTINLGDDLGQVIDYGTQASLFGVIVVSPAFFGRRWTEAELDALQRKRMFLVRHGVEAEDLSKLRPELADVFSISSAEGADVIAEKLVAAISQPKPHADA